MAEYLFVRLTEDSICNAVVLNGDGRVVRGPSQESLESLPPLAEQRRVMVLVPGSEVVTTEASVPPANAARLRQMLPYSLEDTFAEDVERLAFAPGRRLDSGKLAVSVVAKQRLESWLDALGAANIKADAVYAETDGVPDTPSTLTLMLEGERIYGRRPGRAPFCFEGLTLPQLFELLAAQDDERGDLQHVLIYTDAAGLARHRASLSELESRLASVAAKSYSQGLLPHLAASLVFTPGTTLLQGAYAPKSNWRGLLRPWRVAASLLIAAIVIAVLGQAGQVLALQREDRLLTEQLTARCSALVASARISSCAAAVQRRLSEAGAESAAARETFLSTLLAVAESRAEDSLIEAMSYRNSVLDLQITTPSVPALDAFARQITDTDRFDVRIQSANPGDNGVEGRIQVVGASQ